MLYNLYHNFFQMFITCFLGVIGLFLFFSKYQINSFFIKLDLKLFMVVIFVILIIGFIFRNQTLLFKGLTLSNLIRKLKEIPKTVKLKMLLYSFIRYCIFSFLFFSIITFFWSNYNINRCNTLHILYVFISFNNTHIIIV